MDDLGLLSSILAVLVLLSGTALKSLMMVCAGVLLLGYAFFREFSRNVEERKRENLRYLGIWEHLRFRIQSRNVRRESRKTYKYIKCQGCKKTMRILRKKGKQAVMCPHCRRTFEIES